MIKKIIHCDADCFFAAIEMRDNPHLRSVPMAVGGKPGTRSVISTCNYIARKFGIHSAMPSATAMRLCPELIIVPHSMDKYRQASIIMKEIFLNYTDLVEMASLDEAYLDVSSAVHCSGSATRIAEDIRQQIKKSLGITVSAGIATSKFLAKIASDWNKPDGIFVITPDMEASFIAKLPVEKFHGVGKITATKLLNIGITQGQDIFNAGEISMINQFGVFGKRLYAFAQGIDHRDVQPFRTRKSLSVEHTFQKDLSSIDECQKEIPRLLEKLCKRLKNQRDNYPISTLSIKIKFDNFTQTTLDTSGHSIRLSSFQALLKKGLIRENRPVRLLGIGVRFKPVKLDDSITQLELFSIS